MRSCLVFSLLLVLAVGGFVPAAAGLRNRTVGIEENEGVLDNLMRDGGVLDGGVVGRQLSFTTDWCVERINQVNTEPVDVNRDEVPGARAFCDCVASDPPTLPPTRDPANLAEFDRVFDKCKAQVLDGSDYNVVKICRGMASIFGEDLRKQDVSFCGRLCRTYEHRYYVNPFGNLGHGCGDECAREAQPGYCNKYLVTYGEWTETYSCCYPISTKQRFVHVGDERVTSERVERGRYTNRFPYGKEQAQNMGAAMLSHFDNPNEICGYVRGFKFLKHCCYEDDAGLAHWNCDATYNMDLFWQVCYERNGKYPLRVGSFCSYFYYYYEQSGGGVPSLWKDETSGLVYFQVQDQVLLDTSDCRGVDDIATCCDRLEASNMFANCQDTSKMTYIGKSKDFMQAPGTPAPAEGGNDDPCKGLCTGDRQCVLAKNGQAFCNDCSAFFKLDKRGNEKTCCSYDEEQKKCVTALKSSNVSICQRSQDILHRDEDGDVQETIFNKETGYLCSKAWEFRKSGVGCKIVESETRGARCI